MDRIPTDTWGVSQPLLAEDTELFWAALTPPDNLNRMWFCHVLWKCRLDDFRMWAWKYRAHTNKHTQTKHTHAHTHTHTHTDPKPCSHIRVRADAKMHMLDCMLTDIINAVLQQGWPVGEHDLPGDPCMSPLVPVHACECVCVCLLEWKSAVHPCEHPIFQFTSSKGSHYIMEQQHVLHATHTYRFTANLFLTSSVSPLISPHSNSVLPLLYFCIKLLSEHYTLQSRLCLELRTSKWQR